MEGKKAWLKCVLLVVGILYTALILFLAYWIVIFNNNPGRFTGIAIMIMFIMIIICCIFLGLTIGLYRAISQHNAKCINIYLCILVSCYVASVGTSLFSGMNGGGAYTPVGWLVLVIIYGLDGLFLYQVHSYCKLIIELESLCYDCSKLTF